jgi:hypothetical protein
VAVTAIFVASSLGAMQWRFQQDTEQRAQTDASCVHRVDARAEMSSLSALRQFATALFDAGSADDEL